MVTGNLDAISPTLIENVFPVLHDGERGIEIVNISRIIRRRQRKLLLCVPISCSLSYREV